MQRKVLIDLGLCALLASIIVLGYWGVWHFDYVYFDDPGYISENLWVQRGLTWENIRWAFTAMEQSNWHPLTWISHMTDIQFFGRVAHGHHVTNIVFHVLNTSLIFLLLRWMTGKRWAALAVAALFAVHPMHVESVVWIAERKDVLSTFLGLLTMTVYIFYSRRTDFRPDLLISGLVLSLLVGVMFEAGWTYGITDAWFHQFFGVLLATCVCLAAYIILTRRYIVGIYCLIFALYACGLLAKPMLVTLPCVFLLLDYWPLNRFTLVSLAPPRPREEPAERAKAVRRKLKRNQRAPVATKPAAAPRPRAPYLYLLLEKLPLFCLAAVSVYITPIAQRHGGSMASDADLPFAFRIQNALQAYVSYIGRVFWPGKMTVLYLLDMKQEVWRTVRGVDVLRPTLPVVAILVAITVLVLLGTFLLRRRYLAVGWFWFLGVLVPVIGLVQVGEQTMADRYTYLSYVGLFIMGAFGIADVIQHLRQYRFEAGVAALGALAVAVAICTWATHRQVQFWKDPETLLTHALEITPTNWSMNNNMGVLHWEMSQMKLKEAAKRTADAAQAERKGDTKAAEDLNAEAAQLTRDSEALKKDAIAHWELGVSVRDTAADIHNNLGYALAEAGDIDGAQQHLEKSIALKPILPGPHNNLGRIHLKKKNNAGAILEFKRAIELDPSLLEARSNLAEVYTQQEMFREAEEQFRAIVALQSQNIPPEKIPPFTTAHVRLALLCERDGRMPEAAREWTAALALTPGDPHLLTPLARCLWEQGDFAAGQQILGTLVQGLPNRAEFAEQFAQQLDQKKKPREAMLARAFMASILATSPDPAVRNGPAAVRLAEIAATAANGQDADVLDALAMAYAETGRFDDAVRTARAAQTLATSQGKGELSTGIAAKLQLYEKGTPFHLPAS